LLTLNPRFALIAKAIFVMSLIVSPVNATKFVELDGVFAVPFGPVHRTATQPKSAWQYMSLGENAAFFSIFSPNGQTYRIALESDKFSTIKFTNRLFLSDSLNSSDIDLEMQRGASIDVREKLFFTTINVANVNTPQLDVLPLDVKGYLKAASADFINFLGVSDGDIYGGYRDINKAVSINDSSQYVEREQIKKTIIVSREYGDAPQRTVGIAAESDDIFSKIKSLLFSETIFFVTIPLIILFILISKIFTRPHSRRV
jgi:hypothetical protein